MKAILFDLDGTLLPMDQDLFTKTYFKYLSLKMAPYGYNAKDLIEGVWQGTRQMVKNSGNQTNEEVFFQFFSQIFGPKVYDDKVIFDEFYQNEFNNVKESCGYTKKAQEVISYLKTLDVKLILATNPIFPKVAQESRLKWAGCKKEDFIYITSYENMHYCKPNHKYYLEIIDQLGLEAKECLMVGNDVEEDMIAQKVGMQVFLLTPCLINKQNQNIDHLPQGNFDDLLEYLHKNI